MELIPVLKTPLSAPIASIYIVISPKTFIKLNEDIGTNLDLSDSEYREAEYERFKQRIFQGAWGW